MFDAVWMRDLLRRVPVLTVDVRAAQKAGDVSALAYHREMRAWLAEASLALHEAEMDGPCHGGASRVGGHRGSGPLGEFAAHLIDLPHSADASNGAAKA